MSINSPRRSILVIEDDVDIRETLTDILGGAGYTIQCAGNGRDGINALRASHPLPGLCLLDRFLPRMSGEEVLAELAKSPGEPWAKVPVVLLSAAEIAGELPTNLAGFLRKPVELEVLMSVVRSYCD